MDKKNRDATPLTKADLESALDRLLRQISERFDASLLDAKTKLLRAVSEHRSSESRLFHSGPSAVTPDPFTSLRIDRLEDTVKQLRSRLSELEKCS